MLRKGAEDGRGKVWVLRLRGLSKLGVKYVCEAGRMVALTHARMKKAYSKMAS